MTSVPSYPDVELPGQRVTSSTLQTVVMRYVVAGEMASGRRVLELGCGPGIGLEYLQKCGASDVKGADQNAGLLRMAREQSSADVTLVQCDAALDTVLLLEVLMYLTNPVTVLREVRRMLRDGGTVLLSLPNGAALGVPPSGAIVRFYSSGDVGELLLEVGFAAEVFGVFPFREGARQKATRQRMASRVLDGLERCGFPAGLRTRLTSAVLWNNCQLPVRIQSSHRRLLPEGDQGMGPLFDAPDECRVLYARGVVVQR